MKGFWRAVVAALLIATVVAVVAWATAPDDRTGPPPTLIPLMGERPATTLPAIDVNPDYGICDKVECVLP